MSDAAETAGGLINFKYNNAVMPSIGSIKEFTRGSHLQVSAGAHTLVVLRQGRYGLDILENSIVTIKSIGGDG